MAIRRFWWGGVPSKSMAWVSWMKMCTSKSIGGMGFSDLRSFNYAMLTKQVWRVLSEPDLLLSQILKARYFPHSDILRADIGVRPSATWRSMFKTRKFVLQGIRIQIGDGTSTSIWADIWICEDGNFKVLTKGPITSSFPYRVSDLIDQHTQLWNTELVDEVFWPVDQDIILGVPIGCSNAKDRWIWHYSKSGHFIVRTCYHNIVTNLLSSRGTSGAEGAAQSGVSSWNWKSIWELRLPPRIRNFLWRAGSEILPTNGELFRRKVAHSPRCMKCGAEVENIMHVIQSCCNMGKVWSSSPFDLKLLHHHSSMRRWFEYVRSKLDDHNFRLAMTVVWKAWESRNRSMHSEESMAATDFTSWCTTHLLEFDQTCFMKESTNRTSFPTTWSPPPTGTVKVNFDALVPIEENFYSVSTIARNWNGEYVWWAVRRFRGQPKLVECEAHAALVVISWARTKGWNSIVLEGDCLQVINALRSGESSLASYGAYIEDCSFLSRNFSSCYFSFIKPCGNKLAHLLAKNFGPTCTEGLTIPQSLAIYA